MKFCPNVACSHRQRTGTPAEYDVERPDCADCGAALMDGPAYYAAPSSDTAARPFPPGLSSRIGVTVVALAIAIAGPRLLLLPQIETGTRLPEISLNQRNVFSVGLSPILTAALFVELVAWIVPSLRPLRHAGPEGREKLGRAAILLGMVLTLFQAYAIARFQSLLDPGASQLDIIGSLLAGTSLLVLLATWVTRRGLGNGFALLYLVPELVTQGELLHAVLSGVLPDGPPTSAEMARIFAIPALLAGTTFACARWPTRRDEGVLVGASGAEPYRQGAGPRGANPPPLRLPASGIAPALIPAGLAVLLWRLSTVGLIPYNAGALYFETDGAPLVIRLVLTAALVLVFGWGFQTPTAREALWRRVREYSPDSRPLEEGDSEVLAALRRSILPLCVFVILPLLVDVGPGASLYLVPLLTMLVLDLVAEVRARMRIEGELVSVWPEHRVFAADMVAAALRSEGIPVLLRGVLYRTMARFAHPFVPIEVMVPASRAEDATRIVRQIMLGELPPAEVRTDEPAPPAKKKKRKKKPAEDAATA
ncbi:putative signal transducing protein [Polyangium jinanense]|uniref:DUF2007 domain-containing protein n=1 Tax=Polyangium jinanense TaxID=2829994 RepID=A0A9X4AU43_9BACT|nr:DUF2007 domain-containing protein [Polyangium jinanense]MDC3982880.1 DUF2007 domain-containing protein [Polyangium jinanense]